MEASPTGAVWADLRQIQDLGEPTVQLQSEGQPAATADDDVNLIPKHPQIWHVKLLVTGVNTKLFPLKYGGPWISDSFCPSLPHHPL